MLCRQSCKFALRAICAETNPLFFVVPPLKQKKHAAWFEVMSSWAKQRVAGATVQAEPQLNPAHFPGGLDFNTEDFAVSNKDFHCGG